MSEINELVNQKVIPNLPESDTKQIPIFTIIQIVLTAVMIIQKCIELRKKLKNDTEGTLRIFHKPNLFQRMFLRLQLRKKIKEIDKSINADTIVNAILKAGESVTKEDIIILCNAAGV